MQVGIAKSSLGDGVHCGDECAYWQTGERTLLCVVDGLGHGELAAQAAHSAVGFIAGHLSDPLTDIFARCDAALRDTRGAAMGLAIVEEAAGTLTYAAIGNTRGIILRDLAVAVPTQPTVRLTGNYGIVGAGYEVLTPQTESLQPADLVILFTDGLPETIDLSVYHDELLSDAQRLAERIHDDWRTGSDDGAVLVYRQYKES